MKQRTTVVLGGTGKTGRRVAAGLVARGVPVRAASRSGAVPFDWEKPEGWGAALEGATAVYAAYSPDLAAPGATEAMRELGRVCASRGVERLVLLSGRGEPQAQVSESALRAGLDGVTVLRAAWFAQNFSEGHLAGAVAQGELALPGGDVAEPFVDVEDVAEAAVSALLDDAHAGKVYELTGPRLLTFTEVASEIAAATGRPLRYLPISRAQLEEGLTREMPPEHAAFFADLFTFLLDGHNAHLGADLPRLLGRPARDFRAFVAGAVASGVWS
jgi:uncharacterized protein YbjT (DUF2867 family)